MAVEKDTAVVIANGLKQGETILDIVKGKPVGTLITKNGRVELVTSTEQLAEDGMYVCVCVHRCQLFLFRRDSPYLGGTVPILPKNPAVLLSISFMGQIAHSSINLAF